jgi:hypothetical protein
MPGLVFGIDLDPFPSSCCSRLYSVGTPDNVILMETSSREHHVRALYRHLQVFSGKRRLWTTSQVSLSPLGMPLWRMVAFFVLLKVFWLENLSGTSMRVMRRSCWCCGSWKLD